MTRTTALASALALALLAHGLAAQAAEPPALSSARQLTPETALTAARAALAHCRAAGYQVAVAVVDRAGLVQVLLRDQLAGAHTIDVAPRKAWTAVSFRMPTAQLAAQTQAGQPMSGIRQSPQVMAIGGGQVIEAAGAVVGAVGVSGAPGGEADDACALAGVKAVTDLIELGN